MCHLVQSEASVVFEQDAADAPHVTGVTPPQLCRTERSDTHPSHTRPGDSHPPGCVPSPDESLLPSMTSGAL